MFYIVMSFIIVAVITVIIFVFYKMHQLSNLEKMNSNDVIAYVTNNDDNIKISTAIIKDGKITYHVYGKNGAELNNTKYDYEIGSISKTFTALMISKAIEEGKIDLNESLDKYLGFDDGKYYPTIERIITHTSGYKSYYFDKQMAANVFKENNDFYGISKENLIVKVHSINLKDKDYEFKYSNFGISVLGLVLEKVYDKDFVSLMNDFIFSELNLTQTKTASCSGNLTGYWNWKKDDGYIPAGAIISNIEDMSEYLKILLYNDSNYTINTYSSLKQIDSNIPMYEKLGIGMDKIGMTWIIDEKNNITWHNGGTSKFNSYIAFNKDKNIGVVVLGNTSPTEKIPMTVIGAKLMKELCYS